MTLSNELQNKVREAMALSTKLAERTKRTIKEDIIYIAQQVLPWIHYIKYIPSTKIKAIPIITKDNRTTWLSIEEKCIPALLETSLSPSDCEKTMNHPVKTTNTTIDQFIIKFKESAKDLLEKSVIEFLDSSITQMKTELEALPNDKQLSQLRKDRNKALYLRCKELADMYKALMRENPTSKASKTKRKLPKKLVGPSN